MLAEACHPLLVMADSDVRVTPEMLATIAAEFQDPRLGLATCPYRAVPGRSFWSLLEALGLNTEFMAGVLVARMLDGMRFALGPTIAARRETLEHIGGFDAVKDYLAEDFVLGKLAAEHGYGVILSSYVIEHRIGAQPLGANLKHRLRWNRSTRRSRPWGYLGQVFTCPLALALMLCAVQPSWWPLAAVALAFRPAAAWATACLVLHDGLTRRYWWLAPLQDIAGFLVWVGGFFGNTILWRGRRGLSLPAAKRKLWTGLRNYAAATRRPSRAEAPSAAPANTRRASFPRASASTCCWTKAPSKNWTSWSLTAAAISAWTSR
jgi:ceramide glucosyltransferase